ncbi:MAG: GNAT family N-acetyltransferase [Phycisphaerales bacterium]|nr:GNAT family N-acetyltransferase [Phycisphaerales bacterium]
MVLPRFPIHVLACLSKRALLSPALKDLAFLTEEAPVIGGRETFDFILEMMRGKAELRERIKRVLDDPEPQCVLIVSDQLTDEADDGRPVPNDVTREIRDSFFSPNHVCGLVALPRAFSGRVRDVDRAVGLGTIDRDGLRTAVVRTAQGLRLKRPPTSIPALTDDDAVIIQAANSQERLHECLRLRHEVYDAMGYLEDAVAQNSARLEVDGFDLNAVHFAAIGVRSDRVVGTTRLVIVDGASTRGTLIGVSDETQSQQRQWLGAIVRESNQPVLRQRVQQRPFLPLPILQSGDFCERWPDMLNEAIRGGEISRVVTSPPYRGAGVSSVLIRTAIATAYSIGRRFLLLECLPVHEKMYRKYGFRPLGGKHTRLQELDQVAVGMRLELRDTPDNEAFFLAERDADMIRNTGAPDERMLFGSKHLCLCRNKLCWERGDYRFRSFPACPLFGQHAS